ncbi:hypothetical protein B0H14DRAFT_2897640, partial [Mycena olivaceomarginata]
MSSRERHLLDLIKYDATLGVCIPGVTLSGLLLMAVAYLQRNPASRPHLNQVSFRLLVYTLIANIILGVIVLTPSQEVTCSFTSFLGTASIMFSGCMSCCIALNLLFVLVYGFNGNRLEIFTFSALSSSSERAISPPWAAGELGWYAPNGTCWLLGSPDVQLRWLIGTQSVWMILMSLLEVLSFVQILVFMVRHQLRIQSLCANTDTFSGNLSQTSPTSGIATLRSSLPRPLVMRYRPIIIRIGTALRGPPSAGIFKYSDDEFDFKQASTRSSLACSALRPALPTC